jgi:hypothetical protein
VPEHDVFAFEERIHVTLFPASDYPSACQVAPGFAQRMKLHQVATTRADKEYLYAIVSHFLPCLLGSFAPQYTKRQATAVNR